MKKKMKILMIISLLNYGGASKMFIHLANYLEKVGYDVSIYTYVGNSRPTNLSENINYTPSISKNKNILLKSIEPIFNIRKIIRIEQPSLIISFLTNANFYSTLANLGMSSTIIVSERSDPYYESNLKLKLLRLSYYLSDLLVFQTDEAKKYFTPILQKKSVVIPNPVVEVPVIKVKENNEKFKISHVGRFNIIQKRQDLILKSAKILKNRNLNFEINFYGDGPDFYNMKKLAHQLDLQDNVVFHGKVNNVLENIKDSSIFLLASDYEGIPNALMEAMSVGLPVISTDCSPGGAKLLIENFKNGLIVPRDDASSIADAIELLMNDTELRHSLGKNAKGINEKFENKRVMSLWDNTIESLRKIGG